MTQQEYDKKMAELEAKLGEAYKACSEACKVLANAYKAIDDLKESWAKQESEARNG